MVYKDFFSVISANTCFCILTISQKEANACQTLQLHIIPPPTLCRKKQLPGPQSICGQEVVFAYIILESVALSFRITSLNHVKELRCNNQESKINACLTNDYNILFIFSRMASYIGLFYKVVASSIRLSNTVLSKINVNPYKPYFTFVLQWEYK